MEGSLLAIIQGPPDRQLSIVLAGAGTCDLTGLGKGGTLIVQGITRSSSAQTPAQTSSAGAQAHHTTQRFPSSCPPAPPAYSSLFPSCSADFRRSSSYRPPSHETQVFMRSLRDYRRTPRAPASPRSRSPSSNSDAERAMSDDNRRRCCPANSEVNATRRVTNANSGSRKKQTPRPARNTSTTREASSERSPRVPKLSRKRRVLHAATPPRAPPRQERLKTFSSPGRHESQTEQLINRICGNPATGTYGNVPQELKTWFSRQDTSSFNEIEPGAVGAAGAPAVTSRSARLLVRTRRIRYCPKSGHRWAGSPWALPARAADVRYLHDISRCIRDTLRSVCDNNECPGLQQRYRAHEAACRQRGPRGQPATRQLQDVTPIDPTAPRLRLEDVQCTSDGIAIEDEIVCPPCPPRKPCGCNRYVTCTKWEERLIINDRTLLNAIESLELLELRERLFDWLNETHLFDEYTFVSKSDKQERAAVLADILTNITGNEHGFKAKAYEEIKEFINKLPIKYPGPIGELEQRKHEAIENLFKDLVNPENLNGLKKAIENWLIELPLLHIREDVQYRRKLVNEIAAKLKHVIINQAETREEHTNVIYNEVGDVLLSLPLQVTGNVTKVLGHYNEELTSKLADMTPEEAVKKCRVATFGIQEEEAVLNWLQSLPNFAANTPAAICKNKAAVADLINILNALRSKEKHNFTRTLTSHLRFWLRHFAIKQNHFIDAVTTERYVKELVALFRLPDEEVISSGLWLDTENIHEHIADWLPEIPEFAQSGMDEKQKSKIIQELHEILNSIENDEHYLDNVKSAVEKWLEKSDVQFTGSIKERNRRKSEVVQNFLDQLMEVSGMTGLEHEVYEWTKGLPIKRHLGFDPEYFVKETAGMLKPIVVDHPQDKEEYYSLLEDCIDEIIEDVPLRIEGNRNTVIKKVKGDLMERLKRLPSDEAILKVKPDVFGLKEQKQIYSWLSKIPGFASLDPNTVKDNQKLAADLAKVLNPMKAKDPDNFEENVREHLKYWLHHNLLKNNTHLDKKTIDNHVENLVNTLTSEPMQPKKHIRKQLKNDIEEMFKNSRVRVSRQEELQGNILDALMNFVSHKDDEQKTIENLQEIFRKANVSPTDAEDFTEELLGHSKNIARSMPTKRKLKKTLMRPIASILEQEEIKVADQDALQGSLADLLANYRTNKFDDKTIENKLLDRLCKANISEPKAREIAFQLIEQAKEIPKDLPSKRDLKRSLKFPVNDIIDQSGIYLSNPEEFKNNIVDLLADHSLGIKTNEEVRQELVERFRLANVQEEDVQKITDMLMSHSKGGLLTVAPKRQVKQNLKNPVSEILDNIGIRLNNREHFDNSIVDALAAYKLGKTDERGTRQMILDVLRQANLTDEAANEVLSELFINAKEIPSTVPPRGQILQILTNPISENLRLFNQFHDRDDVIKSILDILADYKQGKTDAKNASDQLQTILLRANVPKSVVRGLISDLLDDCKEAPYALPTKKQTKQLIEELVNEVLNVAGLPVTNELNSAFTGTLTDYIQGNIDDRITRDKLFSAFRAVDIPMNTANDIIDDLIDQSKIILRRVMPKKYITKQMLKMPVESVLDEKKIPLAKQTTIKNSLLDTLVEFRHGKIEAEATKQQIIDKLKKADIALEIAQELADELVSEAHSISYTAPTKSQIKQFLKNPTAHIFKLPGLTKDQQDVLIVDTLQTLADYKQGNLNEELAVQELIKILKETNIPKDQYETVITELLEKTDSLPLPLPEKRFIKQNLKALVHKILQKTDIPENNQQEVKDVITESLAVYTQGKSDEITTKTKIVDAMKHHNLEDNEALKYADEFLIQARTKSHMMPSKKQVKLQWKTPVSTALSSSGVHDKQLEEEITDILANYTLGKTDERTTKRKLLQSFRNLEIPENLTMNIVTDLLALAERSYKDQNKSMAYDTIKNNVIDTLVDLKVKPETHDTLVENITDTLDDHIMRKNDDTTTEKTLFTSFREAAVSENEALTYTQKCMELSVSMSMMQEFDKTTDGQGETSDLSKHTVTVDKSGIHTTDKRLQDQIIGTLTDHIMKKDSKKNTKKKLISLLQKANVPEEEIDEIVDQLMEYSKELEPVATSSPKSSISSGEITDEDTENEEYNKEEEQYEEAVQKETVKWLKDIVKDVPEEQAQELVKNITQDIVKRQKYLQFNPNMKVDELDQLRHYRQKAGKWKNKLKELRIDIPEAEKVISNVDHLLKAINKLPPPPVKTYQTPVSKHEKKLSKTLADTVLANAEDSFEKDIVKLTNDLSLSYLGDDEMETEVKEKIIKAIAKKAHEMNTKPDAFKDKTMYYKLLSEEVDAAVSDLPGHQDLDRKLSLLKKNITEKAEVMVKTITDDREGRDYKKELRKNISLVFPPEAKEDRGSFEALKDNLADQFVTAKNITDDEEFQEKYKESIKLAINNFCDEYLKKNPDSPIVPTDKLNEYLFDVLKKVPTPKPEVLETEIDEIKHKNVIKQWMKKMPLERTLTDSEKTEVLRNTAVLAKQLKNFIHQKQQGKLSEPEYKEKVEKEIEKFTNTLPIKQGANVDVREISSMYSSSNLDNILMDTTLSKLDTTQSGYKLLQTKDKEGLDGITQDQKATDAMEPGVCCYRPDKRYSGQRNLCTNPLCRKRHVATNALPSNASTQTEIELSPCGKLRVECPRSIPPPVIIKETSKSKQKKLHRGIDAMPSTCGSQTCNLPSSMNTQTDPRPYYCQIPSVPCQSYCGSYQKPFLESNAPCPSFYFPPPYWSMPYPRCNNFAQCGSNARRDLDEHEIKHTAVGTEPADNICRPCGAPYSSTNELRQSQDVVEEFQENEQNIEPDYTAQEPDAQISTQVLRDGRCECPSQKYRKPSTDASCRTTSPCGNIRLPCPLLNNQHQKTNNGNVLAADKEDPKETSQQNNSFGPCENARETCPLQFGPCANARETCPQKQTSTLKNGEAPFESDPNKSTGYGPCEYARFPCPNKQYPVRSQSNAFRSSKDETALLPSENEPRRSTDPQLMQYSPEDAARSSRYTTRSNRTACCSNPRYMLPLTGEDSPPRLPLYDNMQDSGSIQDPYYQEHTVPECPIRRRMLERMYCEEVDVPCSNRRPWPCEDRSRCLRETDRCRGRCVRETDRCRGRCSRSPCGQKQQHRRTCPSWDYSSVHPRRGNNRDRCNSPGCFR